MDDILSELPSCDCGLDELDCECMGSAEKAAFEGGSNCVGEQLSPNAGNSAFESGESVTDSECAESTAREIVNTKPSDDHANTLAVQSQIADALLERISEGLAGMEAPTNAKDLLAMVETWRKLKGLDAKQGVQSGGILTPMRSVSRQPKRLG